MTIDKSAIRAEVARRLGLTTAALDATDKARAARANAKPPTVAQQVATKLGVTTAAMTSTSRRRAKLAGDDGADGAPAAPSADLEARVSGLEEKVAILWSGVPETHEDEDEDEDETLDDEGDEDEDEAQLGAAPVAGPVGFTSTSRGGFTRCTAPAAPRAPKRAVATLNRRVAYGDPKPLMRGPRGG